MTFPLSESLAQEVVSLPMSSAMTEEESSAVIEAVSTVTIELGV